MEQLIPCGVPTSIIKAPYTVTGGWVDLGPKVINTKSVTALSLWADFTIGTSRNIQFRVKALTKADSADEWDLPIQIIEPDIVKIEPEFFEFNIDVDHKIVFQSSIGDLIPYVKIQWQATFIGGTPAILNQLLVGSTDGVT